MGHYDALIAAWNNPTQPPPGVTGSGLVAGDTTDQKIVKVNAWTITGAVPTTAYFTGDQLANCVAYSEFKALTQQQQNDLLGLLNTSGGLVGGSANTAILPFGMFLDYFPSGSATRQALNALTKATVQVWWSTPVNQNGGGLTSPVSIDDTQAAGLV
jgi:hypothetical protein